MKSIGKILLLVLGFILVAVIALVAFVHLTYDRTFDVEYPSVQISTDSAVLAHGEYLVYGPAHCATCHISLDQFEAVERGEKVPLKGGFTIKMPLGDLICPNITSDPATGIGNRSNEEIARTMRYNITHDGKAMLPLMPFSNMSEYDLNAIISYLRTLEPTVNEVERTKYSFLGRVIKRFMLEPSQPNPNIPKTTDKSNPVVYGEYLANSVANCYGCHTELDEKKGIYIGEPFAGGMVFPSEFNPNRTYISPNLTPDAETGIIYGWSEEQFVSRMRNGRVHQDSPMPWGPFSRMTDEDLKSIYAYLTQIKAVNNKIEKIVIDK